MSIRFYLSTNLEKQLEQIEWCRTNVSLQDRHLNTNRPSMDFMNEEDAIIFSIKFGIKKDSTLLERMIEREDLLEKLENQNLRTNMQGMGPWHLK